MTTTAPLISHLTELRQRLLYTAIVVFIGICIAFIGYDHLIIWLISPYQKLPVLANQPLYVHSLLEGFLTKVKFAIFTGLVMSTPLVVYHGLQFIMPGLTSKEKRLLWVSLLLSVVLASISFYMTYFKLIPYSMMFLTSSQFIPKEVGILLNFHQNVFYVFNLLIMAFMVFQLPLLLGCLLYLNILKRAPLWRAGRYVIIVIFILAAIVTPPDVITQISIAVPLITLYFLTLLIAKLCRWGER